MRNLKLNVVPPAETVAGLGAPVPVITSMPSAPEAPEKSIATHVLPEATTADPSAHGARCAASAGSEPQLSSLP